MKVYNHAYLSELEETGERLSRAIKFEARVLKFASWLVLVEMLMIAICIFSAFLSQKELFQFYLPASFVSAVFMTETTVSILKFKAWGKKLALESEYFAKSKALSNYNSDKLVEMMAGLHLDIPTQELVDN